MRPDEWNKDTDAKGMGLHGDPKLQRWNHFYLRSTGHHESQRIFDERRQAVLKAAWTILMQKRAEVATSPSPPAASAQGGAAGEDDVMPSSDPAALPLAARIGLVHSLEDAHELDVCTFNYTGRDYQAQRWFSCETCGMGPNEGACLCCARNCHDGHRLTEIKFGRFYCDCGAGHRNLPR